MTTNEREVRRQWENHTRRLNEAAMFGRIAMTDLADLADTLYGALANLADAGAQALDMMRMGYDVDAREHPDAPTVGERLAAALDDAGIAIARMERGQA